jgi:hypothetical protein
LVQKHDPASVVGKEKILAEARDFYRGVRSLPLQQEIARGIADLLDLPPEGVAHALAQRPSRRTFDENEDTIQKDGRWNVEDNLLVLLLRGDVAWSRIAAVASPEDFSPRNRRIAEALANSPESHKIADWVIESLREQGDEEAINAVTAYVTGDLVFTDPERTCEDALDRGFRLPAIERKLASIAVSEQHANAAGDHAEVDRLTRERARLSLEQRELVMKRDGRRGMHGRDKGKAQDEGPAEAG